MPVAWLAVGVTGGLASFAVICLLAYVILRQRRRRGQPPQPMTSSASLTTDPDNERASGVSDSDAESCSPVQDIAVSQSTPDLIGRDGSGCLATRRAPDDAKPEGRLVSSGKSPVVKQHTLPTMPQRHMWLHRLLFFLDSPYQRHQMCHGQQQQQKHQQGDVKTPVLAGPGLHIPPPTSVYAGLVQPKVELNLKQSSSRHLNADTASPADGDLDSDSTSKRLICGRLYVGLTVRHEPAGPPETRPTTVSVHVIRADDLPARQFSGTCDPYVKVHLLPDGKAVYQSKLQRRTMTPVYDETFDLSIAPLTEQHQLHFGVYDFDRYSRHDLIGAAVLQLHSHSQEGATERLHVLDIVAEKQGRPEYGELLLSLRYLPTAGRLTVTVLKARHLRATDVTGQTDAFVKVTMTCRGQKISKKKTSIKYSTSSPVFNEAMTFDVPQHIVEEVSIIVNVFHHSSCGGADLVGVCVIGRQYGGQSRDHWFSMLDRPRKAVAQWYPLTDHVPWNHAESLPAGLTGNASEPTVHLPAAETN